jgi:hypothetical protein
MTGPASTAERFATAMTAADFNAVAETIAPDAVLRSPITASFEFRGRREIVELLRMVREAYDELEYIEVVEQGRVGFQHFRARVGGQEMEGLDLMHLDEEGRVREFTVFFRPLPGLAALTQTLAARLAARETPARGRLVGALVRPLSVMTRAGDRAGVILLRRFRRSASG